MIVLTQFRLKHQLRATSVHIHTGTKHIPVPHSLTRSFSRSSLPTHAVPAPVLLLSSTESLQLKNRMSNNF